MSFFAQPIRFVGTDRVTQGNLREKKHLRVFARKNVCLKALMCLATQKTSLVCVCRVAEACFNLDDAMDWIPSRVDCSQICSVLIMHSYPIMHDYCSYV